MRGRTMTDSAAETAKEPRTVSKATFETLVFVTLLVLSITESITASATGRALGFRMEGGWIGGLTVLNMVLARVVVDAMLKRMGRSRSGKTLEVRGRTVAIPEGEVADDERVEVRCPSSLILGLGAMCLAICLLIALILVIVPPARMENVGWAYALIIFFGLGAGYCLYERRWGKPQAWADSTGIWGLPVGFHMRARFVPWSRVTTCEIETYYDTFGKPVIVRPVLKGGDGETLLTPNLLYTTMEDQDRLVKYIKAKLPKPKDDFWE
jgi:hypothetical protein